MSLDFDEFRKSFSTGSGGRSKGKGSRVTNWISITFLNTWGYVSDSAYGVGAHWGELSYLKKNCYLTVLRLSCIMQDLSLWPTDSPRVAAHRHSCPVAGGIQAPRRGIEPMSPALKGRFLTIAPTGKSPPTSTKTKMSRLSRSDQPGFWMRGLSPKSCLESVAEVARLLRTWGNSDDGEEPGHTGRSQGVSTH